MLNTLTFGGLVSSSYGVYISGSGTFSAPERDYQFQAVPGRNGELALDNKRYLDIDVVYPAFIKNNFDSNLANLRSAFSAKIGYQELSDSYHPNEFRLAVFSKGLDVKPIKNLSAGQFEL